jgi:uncharacterized protein YecE (DUF72 family)
MKRKGKLLIGTSGWAYDHWKKIFYPEDLNDKDKLKYFSKHFKTTEINYSFYHLPRPEIYQKWYQETPADFIFSVKTSRFITHIKRLKDIEKPWKIFLKNTLNLKEKLGPILFQFPPNFKATEENIKRLNDFLKLINRYKLKYAFEFRDQSWCNKEIYNLLKKYNIAWVIADSLAYPKAEVITSDFVYIRMHGSKILFSSKYIKKELQDLSQKIKKWQGQGLDVYCYFNNDAYGFAVENAKELWKSC